MNNSERIDKIINEMRMQQADKVVHFQYSRIAKIPFKVHSFIEIMNLRMIDFSESAQFLLNNNKIVPSIPLIRALFENLAVTNRVVKAVESSLSCNKLTDDFDNLLSKIKFGTRYDKETSAINILTQIDKLNKEYDGLKKYYEDLCEFTHPNWDGVEGSYSELDEVNSCTHVQKIITSENSLFGFFQTCFLFVISVFSGQAEWLRNHLDEFAKLCESEIER